MFSGRIPATLESNPLTSTLARVRAAGRAVLDLTISNPTMAGIDYPQDLLRPLGDPRGLLYAPSPAGLRQARLAVVDDFARRGVAVDVDDIVLTSSTSEAYSLLFKVLCDPDDEVLVPTPSYPLFEHLTRLEAVRAVPYTLEYHGRWSIDLDSVVRALSPRTRALLLVSPNNPTGSVAAREDVRQLAALCGPRGISLISDEVFADYELTPGAQARAARLSEMGDVPGFTLGGLSKTIGLPQAKLAWIALSGPRPEVHRARERLELVADTYLSVSTPVQASAADLLEAGAAIRRQILRRVQENHAAVQQMVAQTPSCRVLPADGGWSAVIRVPAIMPEEDMAVELLSDHGVLVHPGYFFDFAEEAFFVVSLLTPAPTLADGVAALLARFREKDVAP